MDVVDVLLKLLYALLVVGVVMGLCSYSVLAERKVCAWIQGRVGPNRTSLPYLFDLPVIGRVMRNLGLAQPIADGLKFLFKEDPTPGHVNNVYYYLAPVIALVPALSTVTVLPFGSWWDATGTARPLVLADLDIGILFILAISSLGVYGMILAGWSANSKYPFLGSIRASAQLISYELTMGLAILPVLMWVAAPGVTRGLSLFNVVQSQEGLWNVLWQPLSALLFLTALFAETNRQPFDMAESETDLVGGFHTEYGAFKFGLFFVGEYAHMIVGSGLFAILFLGGWNFLPGIPAPWPHNWVGSALSILWFLVKICSLIFFFIWMRWTLPRFRYDQVMRLGWQVLLPLAVANLVFYTLAIALWDLTSTAAP